MRIARVHTGSNPVFCLQHPDGSLELCGGSPFTGDLLPLGRAAAAGARLLAPCQPSKIVVLGRNYLDHIRESNREVMEEPLLSLKPPTSVIGPGDPIVYPPPSTGTSRVDPEAELGVVIGRQAKAISEAEVDDCILGYTCLNDVTARDLQRKDTQWTRGKGFDTFCPIGPVIVTDLDPQNLEVSCLVNGIERQRANTNLMLFSVRRTVSFISQIMTLLPGDVIATGTPAGIAPMLPGDLCVIEVGGIGRLENRVVAG